MYCGWQAALRAQGRLLDAGSALYLQPSACTQLASIAWPNTGVREKQAFLTPREMSVLLGTVAWHQLSATKLQVRQPSHGMPGDMTRWS